eukprot:3852832-Amphidinium_carterae.1
MVAMVLHALLSSKVPLDRPSCLQCGGGSWGTGSQVPVPISIGYRINPLMPCPWPQTESSPGFITWNKLYKKIEC